MVASTLSEFSRGLPTTWKKFRGFPINIPKGNDFVIDYGIHLKNLKLTNGQFKNNQKFGQKDMLYHPCDLSLVRQSVSGKTFQVTKEKIYSFPLVQRVGVNWTYNTNIEP
jgi:hypothetical protein